MTMRMFEVEGGQLKRVQLVGREVRWFVYATVEGRQPRQIVRPGPGLSHFPRRRDALAALAAALA